MDAAPIAAPGHRLRPRTAAARLIVALDVPDPAAARALVARLGTRVGFYKIGFELVLAGGFDLLRELSGAGKRVFLDMKLLDIGHTVARAVEAAGRAGVTFLTVHAYPEAMAAAAGARDPEVGPALLAVTVLTSMDDAAVAAAGYAGSAADLAAHRAAAAQAAGFDGLICAGSDATRLRGIVGPGMLLVTPGIRPAGAAAGDQKRIATPAAAIAAGADYLVVGRPILAAADPRAVAEAILAEIAAAG